VAETDGDCCSGTTCGGEERNGTVGVFGGDAVGVSETEVPSVPVVTLGDNEILVGAGSGTSSVDSCFCSLFSWITVMCPFCLPISISL